jgi:mRNA interferase MazF
MPTRIYIPAGEGRLSNDSLALCEQITVVMKSYLEQPAFGQLTPPYLVEIQRGIQIAIGVY